VCNVTHLSIPSERERERDAVRDYLEQNPDATHSEVAEAVDVDVSRRTVSRWADEWSDDEDGDADSESATDAAQASLLGAGDDADASSELAQDAADGDETTREVLADEGTTTAEAATEKRDEKEQEDDEDTEQEGTDDLEVMTSQETDEWSSPREVVEPLDKAVGGFDLDPCSGAESSPFAAATYTAAEDGLAQPWNGSVWVNPPYSAVGDWVDKAHEAVTDGDADCVVFLCKGDSSTEWWQAAADAATVLCAVDHRLSFGDGGNSAPFASHIVVFGEGSEPLRDALAELGTLLTTGWSQ